MSEAVNTSRRGFAVGFATYVSWGLFPIYFALMAPASSFEVISHRAVWGLVFCLVFLATTGRWGQLRPLIRDKSTLIPLLAAGVLIVINWSIWVWAILNGQTVNAALGYFINPLFTVFLAIVFLGERPTRPQIVAMSLGALAIVVMVIQLGSIPWVSIGLPVSFGIYGLIKKRISGNVPVVAGMAIETAAVSPFLIAFYIWLIVRGDTSVQTLISEGATAWQLTGHLLLLFGAGVITVVVLIMFATAAKTLPLSVLGLLQFVSPIMQLIIGVWIFNEHMELGRWIGTAIIWVALIILSWDSLRGPQPHVGKRKERQERDPD